jgi:hypothetical protein
MYLPWERNHHEKSNSKSPPSKISRTTREVDPMAEGRLLAQPILSVVFLMCKKCQDISRGRPSKTNDDGYKEVTITLCPTCAHANKRLRWINNLDVRNANTTPTHVPVDAHK